ncbi:MAG: hypothetical protein AAF432_08005 [Planctomycetota bacterium]
MDEHRNPSHDDPPPSASTPDPASIPPAPPEANAAELDAIFHALDDDASRVTDEPAVPSVPDASADASADDTNDAELADATARESEVSSSAVSEYTLNLDDVLDGVFDSADAVLNDALDAEPPTTEPIPQPVLESPSADAVVPDPALPDPAPVVEADDAVSIPEVVMHDDAPSMPVDALVDDAASEPAIDPVIEPVAESMMDSTSEAHMDAPPAQDAETTSVQRETIAASAVAVTTPAFAPDISAPAARRELEDEDRSIADNVESMLSGDFDSVDEVLDALFDPSTAVIQDDISDRELEAEFAEARDSLTDSIADELVDSAVTSPADAGVTASTAPVDVPAPAEAELATADVVAEMDAAANDAPADMADLLAEAPTSTPADDVPEEAPVEAEASPPPVEASEPEPVAVAATSEPDLADMSDFVEPQELEPASATVESKVSLGALLERAEPIVLPVMRIVSFPMNFVPESHRRTLDFIALTMIFWVPIVWLIALFMSG